MGHSHLFKCPGAVAHRLTDIKLGLVEMCFLFQFELNTPAFVSVSADEHLKGLRSMRTWAVGCMH